MIPNRSASYDRTADVSGQTLFRYLTWGLPATLAALFGITMGATAGEAHEAFFAEPMSGRKVTQYSIELPVNREERETFEIPDDCAEVMRAVNGGISYKGNIVDRRLWKKTESDCRYHVFINRHPRSVLEDHVSNYDFRNARLEDLPLDRRCSTSGPQADPAGCDPTSTDSLGMLRSFPIATPGDEVPAAADCIPCKISNGRFRGYVLLGEDGIECRTDSSAAGVRLIAVDYADINGDRILDAVLRFIPIGPGNNRAPLVLPLTRLDTSAPFNVPGPMLPPRPID